MKSLLAPLVTALGAAFGTASLVHAEILIGVPAPMTGGMSWIGEQGERGTARPPSFRYVAGVLSQPANVAFRPKEVLTDA